MRRLLGFLFLFIAFSGQADEPATDLFEFKVFTRNPNNLPDCPTRFFFSPLDGCWGSWTDSLGTLRESERKDGKETGACSITFINGIKQEGRCVNGEFVSGTVSYSDGSRKRGDFKKGRLNGLGIQETPEGTTYVGEYLDGKASGQGVVVEKDGVILEGIFVNNNLKEKRKVTIPELAKYIASRRHSVSEISVNSHSALSASNNDASNEKLSAASISNTSPNKSPSRLKLPACENGASTLTNCYGTVTFSNRDKYVGDWQNNKMDGQGTYSWAVGGSYSGGYSRNFFEGKGTLTDTRGQTVSGIFQNWRYNGPLLQGQIDGKGYTFNLFNGEVQASDQGYDSLSSAIQASGQKLLPSCDPNVTATRGNCKGTYTFPAGHKYVGEFSDGKFHGQGTFIWTNGNKYVGEFRDGLRHGYGAFTYADGSPPQVGVFEKNIFLRSQRIPDHIAGRTPKKEPQVEKDNETTTSTDQAEDLTPSIPQTGNEKIQVRNERRIALVIGNASYKTAPLDNPINDATDIANELKRRGFKVITRNNANLGSLRQAVRNFSDEFRKSDVGLIYYSGHGVEAKGENYLIPVDADIRKEYELSAQAYPASQLTAMMEEVQSSDDKKRVAILILDACRDNPLTRSWRSSGRGLARMDAPAGTFISFSTAPGSVAADGRGRNSPFTKHLLQAMRKPDVPIELMFKEVRVGVMGETKGEQIPWDSSSLTGDFYFSRSAENRTRN